MGRPKKNAVESKSQVIKPVQQIAVNERPGFQPSMPSRLSTANKVNSGSAKLFNTRTGRHVVMNRAGAEALAKSNPQMYRLNG